MRFHVLGIGAIGTFISHNLRLKNPDAPISLIVRAANKFPSTFKYPRGKEEGRAPKLYVTRNGHTSTSEPFDQEIYQTRQTIDDAAAAADPDIHYGPIRSLIVCLKAPTTLYALSQLKNRIAPTSVIALLQNGMGVYDELCEKVWPEPATRPFFILGTTTHGVTASTIKGRVTHNSKDGEGDIKWGLVPDPRHEVDLERWVWGRPVSDAPVLTPPESPLLPLPPVPTSPTSPTDLSNVRATLSALLSLSDLNSTLLPMPHIHHILLLKLALNANINPLTAIIGAGSLRNGSLVGSSPSRRLIKMLSGETSSIITSYLHQIHAPHSPPSDVLRLYTRDSLVSRTLALCHATAQNTSSMAADALAGQLTEIDHINGYLISLAERLNIPTPHHEMVREMVKFTAEVTGLQHETSTSNRVAQRQNSIKTAKAMESATQESDRQDLMRERFELEKEKNRMDRMDSMRAKRAKRRVKKAKRKEEALKSGSPVSSARSRDSMSAELGDEDENQDKSATLAHLAELAKANTPRSTGRSTENEDESSVDASSEPFENESNEQEEQDEAIKAIESRIFSRSGRRGF